LLDENHLFGRLGISTFDVKLYHKTALVLQRLSKKGTGDVA